MRLFGPVACACLLGVIFAGCATGTAADDTSVGDSGSKTDSSSKNDSGTPPNKDSGTPPKDSGGTQDTGTTPCGGQCLGGTTCCNNQCVDTTSDQNNCGSCGSPCGGSLSCCSSSCVDTMGSDDANCGGCGIPCSGTCVNGSCQTQCTVDNQSQGCTHSVCTSGSALPEDCDINDDDITFYVCDPEFDGLTSCCTSSWTSSCVTDADFWLSLFNLSCQGC